MPSPIEEKMEDVGEPADQLAVKGKGKKGKGKGMMKGKGKGMMKGKGKGKFGGGQQVVEKVVYQRRSRNAGIHTIEIYNPQFWFSQQEMEEFDARPDRYGPSVIGKYTKGIGQVEARFPTDDEDPTSYAMTAVHRLLERLVEKGLNETGKYQPDGVALNIYNAVGRLDVGTESITDRSKSMKSYCMDIFERYGNGESNIEGVDQYNACYGGQACGLCTLSWVESDRWDGRYGIAVATDISEADPYFMAFVGASCTATLFFPDAPLAHHSQRASCILHRFDFFKPVGWHHMGPVTDGKYSVEVYLDALDACYKTLRKKLNDRDILKMTDFNVFHTGGGYHIVRKAFERMVRCEDPDIKGAAREQLVEDRLHPSVSILKIVGPCHTVSSFLNISSVCMNTMEKGLGKVIVVFTYGSGCASSMYQMRIDDVAYFDPMEIWKIKFYRNAIKVSPEESAIHGFYTQTWMQFGFRPQGRKVCNISTDLFEDSVYYLMEIDKFGRRFYHRGSVSAGAIAPEHHLFVDRAEGRLRRRDFEGPYKKSVPSELKEKSVEEIWREIEYDMTYDHEAEAGNTVTTEHRDRYNPNQVVTVIKPLPDRVKHGATIEPDGLDHTYQVLGTWSRYTAQGMEKNSDGSWTFEVVLGENRWEEFYLTQDNDPAKMIYPYTEKAFKGVPCVGPHAGGKGKLWLLDGRDRVNVPEDQVGQPGEKYLVTFRWDKLKDLQWEKLEGETGDVAPSQYSIIGTWCDWAPVELAPDATKRKGWRSIEVQMTSLGIEFKVLRNDDESQVIYPSVRRSADLPVTMDTPISGPDSSFKYNWKIEDKLGAVYKIMFFRDPEDCEATGMKVEWAKTGDRPVVEPEPTYYIVGTYNEWGATGMTKMEHPPDNLKIFRGEVPVQELVDPAQPDKKKAMMPFKIMQHKMTSRCVHPDKDACTQLMGHKVLMDGRGDGLAWHIGKQPSDKAKVGDIFIVRLEVNDDGTMKVTWAKKY